MMEIPLFSEVNLPIEVLMLCSGLMYEARAFHTLTTHQDNCLNLIR